MGWFTGKQGSEAMDPDRGSISDKDWRRLQERAAKANPKLRDTFSRESAARAKAGAEQYRKREQS